MQQAPRNARAYFPAVLLHLRTLAQHLGGDIELLVHDGRGTLLARQFQARFPAGNRHLARSVLGELHRLGAAVFHAQQREGGAQAQEAHAVAALAHDLVALLFQRQAVDLDHVVEHAREGAHHFAVFVPVEARLLGERIDDETREVHRTQQARAIGRQRLLAARVGGADVLAPPVVVHLVDAVDEDEAWLGEVIGGRHDDVPHAPRRNGLVHLAGHQALVVDDVAIMRGPLAPDHLRRVVERFLGRIVFLLAQREGQFPVGVVAHRGHELVGDEQ